MKRQKLLFQIVLTIMILWNLPSVSLGDYHFDDATLQGWTIEGIHAASNYIAYGPNPFSLIWDDALQYPDIGINPLGNNLGSARADAPLLTMPASFPAGELYWFIDFVSPDVTLDKSWQKMTGVTAKITDLGTMPM